jgi:hypothetical protein
MADRVRVIRVLEYDYPDQATAEVDMANWGVPPNGVRHGWGPPSFRIRVPGTVIRSATTFPETMPHEEEERDDRTES